MVNWGVSLTCIPVQGNMRRGLGSLWQTQLEWRRVERKYLNRPLSNFGDSVILAFLFTQSTTFKSGPFQYSALLVLPFPSYKMCPFTIIQVDKSQVSRAALCFCCLIKLVSSLTLGWSGNVSSSRWSNVSRVKSLCDSVVQRQQKSNEDDRRRPSLIFYLVTELMKSKELNCANYHRNELWPGGLW